MKVWVVETDMGDYYAMYVDSVWDDKRKALEREKEIEDKLHYSAYTSEYTLNTKTVKE